MKYEKAIALLRKRGIRLQHDDHSYKLIRRVADLIEPAPINHISPIRQRRKPLRSFGIA